MQNFVDIHARRLHPRVVLSVLDAQLIGAIRLAQLVAKRKLSTNAGCLCLRERPNLPRQSTGYVLA